jgi:hypothetical protein
VSAAHALVGAAGAALQNEREENQRLRDQIAALQKTGMQAPESVPDSV